MYGVVLWREDDLRGERLSSEGEMLGDRFVLDTGAEECPEWGKGNPSDG